MNSRLKQGLDKRISPNHLKKSDIWIQAASAGEAFLAVEIVKHLFPDKPTRILITSTTLQGMEILQDNITDCIDSSISTASVRRFNNIICEITWFPFDMPEIMEKAVSSIRPILMIILETELWPGLLLSLKRRNIKILMINARLSNKSYKSYFKTAFLWRLLAPDHILAITKNDEIRFRTIFEASDIGSMPNIKFDAVYRDNDYILKYFSLCKPGWPEQEDQFLAATKIETCINTRVDGEFYIKSNDQFLPLQKDVSEFLSDNLSDYLPVHGEPLNTIISRKYPLSILVSVRREEEDDAEKIITELLHRFPCQVVAVFPRHMHRIEYWKTRLTYLGFQWQCKSKINGSIKNGSIVLWDIFGETKTVYPFVVTAFIGGSLKPLGGQNFIESVIWGIPTVTGPFTDDFDWVGEDIFKTGLVKKVPNWQKVADFMVHSLENPCNRGELRKKAQAYILNNRGGTDIACRKIKALIKKY